MAAITIHNVRAIVVEDIEHLESNGSNCRSIYIYDDKGEKHELALFAPTHGRLGIRRCESAVVLSQEGARKLEIEL